MKTLVKQKVGRLTSTQAARLDAAAKEKAEAVEVVRATDEHELWHADLDAFLVRSVFRFRSTVICCAKPSWRAAP